MLRNKKEAVMLATKQELIKVLGERLLDILVSLPKDSKEALRQLLAQESDEEEFPDESQPSLDAFIGEAWALLQLISEDLWQTRNLVVVFRNFHKLVGLSALFGFTGMTNLCRQLEVLFEGLAENELQMTPEISELVDESIVALRTNVSSEDKEQIGKIPDLDNLLERLKQFIPA